MLRIAPVEMTVKRMLRIARVEMTVKRVLRIASVFAEATLDKSAQVTADKPVEMTRREDGVETTPVRTPVAMKPVGYPKAYTKVRRDASFEVWTRSPRSGLLTRFWVSGKITTKGGVVFPCHHHLIRALAQKGDEIMTTIGRVMTGRRVSEASRTETPPLPWHRHGPWF